MTLKFNLTLLIKPKVEDKCNVEFTFQTASVETYCVTALYEYILAE